MMSSAVPAPVSQVLKEPLHTYPIPKVVHEEVSNQLWASTDGLDASSTYFEFYAKRVRRHLPTGEPFCLRNHSDVIYIAKMILQGKARSEISLSLRPWIAEVNDVEEAIDLCASLLTMTDIEHPGQPRSRRIHGISGRTPLIWENGSLQTALTDHFAPQRQLIADNQKLGRGFTARNLARVGGIEIRWTTNLEDHLRLVEDDEVVLVFRGVDFLQLQQALPNPVLPKQLISETLDTIALLFPSNDLPTKKWLARNHTQQNRKFVTAPEPDITKCGTLRASQRRIGNFSIWHDRLIILKQAFDESQPATLSQWWFDRRNRVQWYTFWVAILVFIMTMFFGLVQSIEGALQVYLAYQDRGKAD